MKSWKWEQVMSLSLDELRERYPWGAKQDGDKWKPAEEDEVPGRYLEDLEKAKEQRQEKPNLLHRDSSRGYTHDPAMAMKPDVGEAPPKPWLRENALQAQLHHSTFRTEQDIARIMGSRDALLALRSAYEALGEKQGVDVRSNIRLVERGIRALDRQLGIGEEAA